jgi:hypothetical protein
VGVGAALGRRREAAVPAGAALGRREAAVGGEAPERREEAAVVAGMLARCVAVTEEPGEIRGPPVVVPLVSEAAAGQEVYVRPGAQ